MTASTFIHAQVVAKVQECLAKAEARYKMTFPMPRIEYFSRGTTAGFANYVKWTMQLHSGLLNGVTTRQEMIDVTVPHEVAHLVTDRVYPEAHRNRGIVYTRRGVRRAKREVHGADWKEVMAVFGVDDSRCHDMDTSAFAKPKAKYDYKCVFCDKRFTLGPKLHKSLQCNPLSRMCFCRNRDFSVPSMVLVQALGKVTYDQAKEVRAGILKPKVPTVAVVKRPGLPAYAVAVKTTKPAAKPIPSGDSKIAKCYRLFEKYYPQKYDRAAIIQFFEMEGCTAQGAATYYANCKNIYDSQ